jgi:putative toxin-antitoxin system antitoxin component (TIGR02293 family)
MEAHMSISLPLPAPSALPEVIGLAARRAGSEMAVADAVAQGLPVAALERLLRALDAEGDALRHAFVPRATLARRLREKRLSAEESARVARVAGVYAAALNAWGSEAEARTFLRRPHPLLEDRTPLEVSLATDLGARLVEKILGRLRHGIPA